MTKELEAMVQFLRVGKHLPYGNLFGPYPNFDFMDANLSLVPFGVNDDERRFLSDFVDAHGDSCNVAPCDISLEDLSKRIVLAETNIDIANYNVYVSAEGARGAIKFFIRKLTASDQRKFVAYASPNWVFDRIVTEVDGVRGYSFHATSADEFVDGFERLKNKDLVAALMIIDPANPLGYRLDRDHIERLEVIAEKEGIVIIFDDIFRGLQAQGERHSSSRYSSKSIIVEGTSKRFGPRGLGVTWSLVPKALELDSSGLIIPCEGCKNAATKVTRAIYESNHGDRIREYLIANALAFRQGFRDVCEYGEFREAFPGMPLFTYHLPIGSRPFASEIVEAVQPTLGITAGSSWVCDAEFKAKASGALAIYGSEFLFGESYLRICPTKETPDRSYYGGRLLGSTINIPLSKK